MTQKQHRVEKPGRKPSQVHKTPKLAQLAQPACIGRAQAERAWPCRGRAPRQCCSALRPPRVLPRPACRVPQRSRACAPAALSCVALLLHCHNTPRYIMIQKLSSLPTLCHNIAGVLQYNIPTAHLSCNTLPLLQYSFPAYLKYNFSTTSSLSVTIHSSVLRYNQPSPSLTSLQYNLYCNTKTLKPASPSSPLSCNTIGTLQYKFFFFFNNIVWAVAQKRFLHQNFFFFIFHFHSFQLLENSKKNIYTHIFFSPFPTLK